MERVEYLLSTISNIFTRAWNGFVGILARVFPEDFAFMIAVALLMFAFFAIFRAVITKR